MRHYILLIIVFLTTLTAQSQYEDYDKFFVSLGFDPHLATTGAYDYDTTPTLDIQLKFGTRLVKGFETGLQFEYANLKPYYFSSGIFLNYIISNRKSTIFYAIGIEGVMIDRGFNQAMEDKALDIVLSYGFNGEVRFKVYKGLYIGLLGNVLKREDLVQMYDEQNPFKFSGFVRFIYEFPEGKNRWR